MPEICNDKAGEHRGKDVGNEGVIHRYKRWSINYLDCENFRCDCFRRVCRIPFDCEINGV